MAVLTPLGVQCGINCSVDPHGGIHRRIAFPDDGIDALKSKAGYLAQLVGVAAQNIYALGAELFIAGTGVIWNGDKRIIKSRMHRLPT